VKPTFTLDPSSTTREAWLSAWQTDRAQIMEDVCRLHAEAIRLRAQRVCGRDDAADVTQEVLLRLWRNPAGFDPAKGPLRSYLLMLAHGVAIDLVRSTTRRRQRDERAMTLFDLHDHEGDRLLIEPVLRHEAATRVHAALDGLDPRHRQAITARFFDDVTFDEAARRHGVPEGTVKSRVRLGMAHLRPLLADLHDRSRERGVLLGDYHDGAQRSSA
jgi:RNA polymerase sigma-70 factor, ECF subfamily